MSTDGRSQLELDADQQRVLEARVGDRRIVLAGPGSGKSHVVGALAERFVEEGVYPEEILVVSFSRAAVDVVRRRTAHVADHEHGVETSTLDSLAARFVQDLSDEEASFTGYEASIRRATELLREHPGEGPLRDVRHIIVDEVQDVVGARAEFVLALLEHAVPGDTGFTLLGDPLQSLYDFQITARDAMRVEDFLREVRERFAVEDHHLTGDHRSRSSEVRAVVSARPGLTAMCAEDRALELRSMTAELLPLGGLDDDAAHDIAQWPGKTALLCDTNAGVALTVERLAQAGVVAEAASSLADPGFPAWFGRISAAAQSDILTFDSFREMAPGELDLDEAWSLLHTITQARREVDLRKLPDGLTRHRRTALRSPERRITVSTVHRAKGLEFDNVVVVGTDRWSSDSDDADSRRLFVALTRARDRLVRVNGPDSSQWRRDVAADRTWVRSSFRNRRARTGLIIEPSHARALGPGPSDFAHVLGREVHWEHDGFTRDADGADVPTWLGTVDGVPVARTGEEFGRMIAGWAFTDGHLPRLEGGRVQGEETVVGRRGSGRGVWVGARIAGPVTLGWGM